MGVINNSIKYMVMVLSFIFLIYPMGYGADDDISVRKFISEEKQRQWEAAKTKLAYDHGVCLEHCGGDKACVSKCEESYKSRLNTVFKSLTQETDEISSQTDIVTHPSCSYCGMDRVKFASSRIYILYDDGSSFGGCSIHCAAVDLAVNIDKSPISIKVGDYNAQKLIDAEKAYWIIGGSLPGVMTMRAKWAFETKEKADEYINKNGGEHGTFENIMEASYEDMYRDTKMIREKRKKMRMMKKQ